MTYLAITLALSLPLTCWLFLQNFLDFLEAERRKTREERNLLLAQLKEQAESFRSELAALNQARMEETANLLQRIQAPEQAVASHVAEQAPPDPPPVNLEDDQEMFEVYEQRIRNLGALSG